MEQAIEKPNSHSVILGYILWLWGWMGAHRFYYGKPVTGTIYFFSFGLLGIGWLIDLLLIPGMDQEADRKYIDGPKDYNVTWLLLIFLGPLGGHRFYMEKWVTGVIYLLTGGLCLVGWLYDLWTVNGQVSEINKFSHPTKNKDPWVN